MAYRKAKSIELHEAGIVITTNTEQYILSPAAGRSVQASRPGFFLRWSDVVQIARRVGINLPGGSTAEGELGADGAVGAEFPVFRAYYETPANTPGLSIIDLECDVQDEQLVEVRITSRVEGAQPGATDEVQIVTHSGSFTIWWAADQPVDTQAMTALVEAHPPIPVEGETDITRAIGTAIEIDIPDPEEGVN